MISFTLCVFRSIYRICVLYKTSSEGFVFSLTSSISHHVSHARLFRLLPPKIDLSRVSDMVGHLRFDSEDEKLQYQRRTICRRIDDELFWNVKSCNTQRRTTCRRTDDELFCNVKICNAQRRTICRRTYDEFLSSVKISWQDIIPMNNYQTAIITHLGWLNMPNDKRSNTPVALDICQMEISDSCMLSMPPGYISWLEQDWTVIENSQQYDEHSPLEKHTPLIMTQHDMKSLSLLTCSKRI